MTFIMMIANHYQVGNIELEIISRDLSRSHCLILLIFLHVDMSKYEI